MGGVFPQRGTCTQGRRPANHSGRGARRSHDRRRTRTKGLAPAAGLPTLAAQTVCRRQSSQEVRRVVGHTSPSIRLCGANQQLIGRRAVVLALYVRKIRPGIKIEYYSPKIVQNMKIIQLSI